MWLIVCWQWVTEVTHTATQSCWRTISNSWTSTQRSRVRCCINTHHCFQVSTYNSSTKGHGKGEGAPGASCQCGATCKLQSPPSCHCGTTTSTSAQEANWIDTLDSQWRPLNGCWQVLCSLWTSRRCSSILPWGCDHWHSHILTHHRYRPHQNGFQDWQGYWPEGGCQDVGFIQGKFLNMLSFVLAIAFL